MPAGSIEEMLELCPVVTVLAVLAERTASWRGTGSSAIRSSTRSSLSALRRSEVVSRRPDFTGVTRGRRWRWSPELMPSEPRRHGPRCSDRRRLPGVEAE